MQSDLGSTTKSVLFPLIIPLMARFRPDSVEKTAQQSATAMAYVVAVMTTMPSRGCAAFGPSPAGGRPPSGPDAEVKDVTSRYISSSLGLQKLRDGHWWEATLRALGDTETAPRVRSAPIRDAMLGSQSAEALRHPDVVDLTLDQPGVCSGADEGLGGSRAGDVGGSRAREAPDQRRSGAMADQTVHAAMATATAPGMGRRPGGGSRTSAGGGRRGTAVDDPVGGAPSTSSAEDGASRLRSQREDQELQRRASSLMQDLPTTIEGFKAHPLYILKRHLTKYQVGPHVNGGGSGFL